MRNIIFWTIWIVALISTMTVFVGYNYLGKYIPLEVSLQKIKHNQYRDGYKCKEFSEDLIKELKEKGIQAEIVAGESPETLNQENIFHYWVGVWVEPQTGSFTNGYIK